ncbi:MAG: hypothetical protein ACYDCL_01445 [Myxococcales bacterium]
MKLDLRVPAFLEARQIPCCLIGATALAAHGLARYTADVDFLALDGRVLSEAFWQDFPERPEVRTGDAADPLRGLVRWSPAEGFQIDLVVGKGHAARYAVETSEVDPAVGCRLAMPLALVLLKLEAGSPQDRYDILGLVRAQRELNGAPWLAGLDGEVARLSPEARRCFDAMRRELDELSREP